ncbi:transglutaminase family protein [Methylicorpusculum oleiharenae]|uniref:transglutaminase family protein n=1 Tax=Methylicorpusculum oleiharenae TaxID=1338687 RepID=UPI00135A28E6|nr:transglutaminase family protein [Methylicorpusculum oleiharenae]MCD2450982.1 transglutaminase family protein [Methylicorpusculum oleiharenae]
MTIRVAINHKTSYQFDRAVSLSPHVFRLRPAVHCRTPIKGYALRIEPKEHFINWQQDPFGNILARVVFPEKCQRLSVEVEVIADLTVINPFDFFVEEYAVDYPFKYDAQLFKELEPNLVITEDGPLLTKWLKNFKKDKRSINDFLVDVNRQVFQDIGYNIRMEVGIQSCEETLTKRSGSCRDSAWLLVQILRHLGLAARFVSGYLVQLTADVKSLDGPSGPEHDFTDLHAWTEVYIPGAGWIGLDPTSGLLAGEGHIPLACTPDPASAAPVSGATDKCEVSFEFDNSVTRLHEDPRVTKPYTDEQWYYIDALGQQVDRQLLEDDVRLTMGGEPTFVSVDDMEGAEWNTLADGDHKRERAHALTLRLRDTFAAGAMLHYGQGKWYPGEPLPRWQYGCFWRKDGFPVWRNPDLLADITKEHTFTVKDAYAFMRQLTQRLGIKTRYIVTAFEDAFYYVWQEGNIPENLDPFKVNLKDSLDRRTLASVLENDLSEPVGFSLPIQWDWSGQRWQSGPWNFRRGAMFLIPGNSPMGMRQPLDSLPWVAPDKRDSGEPQSLFQDLPELGDYYGEVTRRYSHLEKRAKDHPEIVEQAAGDEETVQVGVPHTSICVEVRNGMMHVFLPPMTLLEHYLELVAGVEATAESLKIPVVLEGYEPPRDYRIERLMITPDPGVIEVNIHPSKTWQELVDKTTVLYEQAHLVRLGTEKFMLDGRHTGTGGGNHITMGAESPIDSPLLRRPDLLRSLITYWQHHPGLSYLFSGMFIGPTSQAPRVDEGRDEKLYELEIAFQQMPEGESPAPWLVDRLLRHLLTDITGNTHRSEFCIDKLYSPDSSTGRLGILELRAFEMPPHARMSLVQMVLLRSLIAWFWREPYKHELVRWGTELHDRFMLPHYVKEDMKHVVKDLQRAGYPFELEWLDPFFEFRFPRYGNTMIDDMDLELRFAIEPWHVLGEEVSRAGTARYVDSSVERLQVKVTGFTEGRYVLSCNGRRLQLRNTGRKGEYVAGVRYRAWQPPSALHPTISPHTPLVFDVIDTWNGHAIGGCTYFVAHPGGRSYDAFPVNAYEAEARRITRFWDYGHTPGTIIRPPMATSPVAPSDKPMEGRFVVAGAEPRPMAPPQEEPNKDFPYTLDLRYRN